MAAQPIPIGPSSLGVMRRVLAEASLGLGIEEGSLAHEELAARILDLFEIHANADAVLVAALEGRTPAMPDGDEHVK